MAAGRLVLPQWMPAVDSDGIPLPNAEAFFYQNKTTTLTTIYADEDLTTPLPNPVAANSSGRFPAIWADDGSLYSATVTADYIPAGTPFTFDNLMPSQAADAVLIEQAEAAVAQAALDAAAAAAALAEIEDIAANAPDAPSVVNKANRDGDNIVAIDFRTALETARIPTVEKYGTAQLAANAAAGLPFFANDGSTIVIPCSDGDIQSAYDKARVWSIGRTALVDIQVAAGDFTLPATVTIENPYGGRIKISDAGEDALTLVSMGTITGSAGNYSVPLTVSDATLAVDGRYMLITAAAGTGSFRALNGLHEITDVTGNVVTINVKCQTANLAGGGAVALTSAALRLPKTIIRAPASNTAFIYKGRNGDGSGVAVTIDLCVVGSGTASGSAHFVDSGAKLSLASRASVSGFQFAIRSVIGANVMANGIIVSGVETGAYALSGSQIQATGAVFTGCSGSALSGAYGSTFAASTIILAGNNRHAEVDASSLAIANAFMDDSVLEALLCSSNGTILATGCAVARYSENVAQGGIRATKGGYIDFGSSTGNTAVTGWDLRAEKGGTIRAVGATFGRASPAVNMRSNDGGYIYTSDTASNTTRYERLAIGSDGAVMATKRSATLLQDVASIAAQSTASFTVTVTGVTLTANNVVKVDWNGGAVAGLILDGHVTAADTVTVQLHNITAGAIDPPSRTYRVEVTTYA